MGLFSKLLGTTKEKPQPRGSVPPKISSNKDDASEYFRLLGAIQDWQAKRQYRKMLECCAKSLPVLPALVSDCKRQYGRFDISSIPAIEIGCRYWAALNDKNSLEAVDDAIKFIPELREGWSDLVRAAFVDERLAKVIQDHIEEHPGTLQNRLGKLLNVSGRDTSRIVRTLTNLGRIDRRKSGNTYELHLKKDKAS